MHQFLVVHKNHKSWRFNPCLGNIVKPEPFSLVGRGLLESYRLTHDLVQHTSGNPHGMIFVYHINQVIQTGKPLPCDCRDKCDFRIGHVGENFPDPPGILVHGLIVFLNGIPLIYGNNDGFPTFMGNACDLGILFCYPFHRVYQKDYNIRPLHSAYCPHDHVAL